MSLFCPFLFSAFYFFVSIAQATLPSSKTFNFLVEGVYDGVITEADNLYYADLPVKTHPFALCVYGIESAFESNDTALTLALRLDSRLVWQANREKPVTKNSTVSLRSDGNLLLTNAQGHVVWQTNTANKGVVDLQLLPNGNLVLLDIDGGFIWQSFKYPTDTILVGQSLLPGDANKLTSRISPSDVRKGPYSLVMDGGRMVFYYQRKHSSVPEIYSLMESIVLALENNTLANMTLQSGPVDQEPYFFDIKFNFTSADSSTYSVVPAGLELKFDTTYSFLQLSQDGNLRIYTYFDKVHFTFLRSPWDETFTMFSRKLNYESECQLPERCGKFGVCEDNQCVACPTANGLIGWSKRCAPPKLPSCNNITGTEVNYYQINGVDHFSSNFSSNGPMRFGKCKEKCTKDCRCSGFFYRRDTSKCLITTQLNTLTRVSHSNHQAFIKFIK